MNILEQQQRLETAPSALKNIHALVWNSSTTNNIKSHDNSMPILDDPLQSGAHGDALGQRTDRIKSPLNSKERTEEASQKIKRNNSSSGSPLSLSISTSNPNSTNSSSFADPLSLNMTQSKQQQQQGQKTKLTGTSSEHPLNVSHAEEDQPIRSDDENRERDGDDSNAGEDQRTEQAYPLDTEAGPRENQGTVTQEERDTPSRKGQANGVVKNTSNHNQKHSNDNDHDDKHVSDNSTLSGVLPPSSSQKRGENEEKEEKEDNYQTKQSFHGSMDDDHLSDNNPSNADLKTSTCTTSVTPMTATATPTTNPTTSDCTISLPDLASISTISPETKTLDFKSGSATPQSAVQEDPIGSGYSSHYPEQQQQQQQQQQQLLAQPSQPIRRPITRARTQSSPVQSRLHKPLEHLSDLGPLEEAKPVNTIHSINSSEESDILSNQNPTSSSSGSATTHSSILTHTSNVGKSRRKSSADTSIQQQQRQSLHRLSQLSECPSSSTLVSEGSSSSYSTIRPSKSSDQRATDMADGVGGGGLVWSGSHPLLMDYTVEPETLEDERYRDLNTIVTQNNKDRSMSMSVDTRQAHYPNQTNGKDVPPLEQSTRRRRNTSKADGNRGWAYKREGKKEGHSGLVNGKNTTGSVGKRVIIHQITPTDTLVGIALYYGIQLSVLKKSNKLWTNDSIHTRKYLYIPFEECTVTKQEGVLVDEANQTVTLPQRIRQPSSQHYHSRSGSVMNSQTSRDDFGNEYARNNNNSIHDRNSAVDSTLSGNAATAPAVKTGINIGTGSPRVGTWVDPKSIAAPPMSSPTMTSTSLTLDNSLRAAPVSSQTLLHPRRSATDFIGAGTKQAGPLSSSTSSTSSSSSSPSMAATAVSENLPNTVVVPPSMTHEALAARFKEMDLVTQEQQHRKALAGHQGQGQEMRTNPVHQRHRTMDLRHYATARKLSLSAATASTMSATTTATTSSSPASSPSSSNIGSRRGSVDTAITSTTTTEPAGGNLSAIITNRLNHTVTEEEDTGGKQQPSSFSSQSQLPPMQSDFMTFGTQHHIYEADDLDEGHRTGYANVLDAYHHHQHNAAGADTVETTVMVQQGLITVPAGVLSFFPSPEHSKKLETPESIAQVQNQVESNYSYHASSLSGSSVSSSSLREALSSSFSTSTSSLHNSHRKVGGLKTGTKTKGRTALSEETFQTPSSTTTTITAAGAVSDTKPSTSSASTGQGSIRSPSSRHPRRTPSSSSSSYNNHARSPTSPVSGSTTAYSKTLRVNQPYYSAQRWSMMGESLVDELLGAVRGPLQIARRVYNLTATLGFGDNDSDSDSNNNDISSSKSGHSSSNKESSNFWTGHGTRRWTSIRGSGGRRRNKEYHTSAIELQQAFIFSAATTKAKTTTTTTTATATMFATGSGSGSTSGSGMGTSTSTSIANGPAHGTLNGTDNNGPINTTSTTTAISTTLTPPTPTKLSFAPVVNKNGTDETPGSPTTTTSRSTRRTPSTSSSNQSSVRKRSLRSSNPVNRAALVALVNELEKDNKREREQEKEKQYTSNTNSDNINSLSTQAKDILSPL
ncbi:hypothetical protein BCR41DRAFT_422333 [Lobosporangium transversale]|uniref:LysM domain-containing protein n=1 Tax=Lobosporangium transversale TaxID=64571 RepID=A0A1Y2GMN6_9FUNG|nr:hypothetical protein BCR41DRAFT_422333 [Lobosporangium transversale]ORZ15576.1 hypothetical protein BCR41DRAFT_422333 [Lobosporangium transversale]|eukprot:XP_021881324.1 hypothetical protein BCR41DRAFT_422333 [Lobosporangium transversale]